MRSHIGRMLVICWVFGGAGGPALAAPPTPAQLAQWVLDLDADSYWAREEAGRQLLEAGDAAIDVLAAAAAKGSPETAWRASDILERIALEGSETALVRVTAAFEQLSKTNRPGLEKVAGDLRARQTKMRRDRAAVRIRALGGKLSGGGDEAGFLTFGGFGGGFFPGLPFPLVDVEVFIAPGAFEAEEVKAIAVPADGGPPVEAAAIVPLRVALDEPPPAIVTDASPDGKQSGEAPRPEAALPDPPPPAPPPLALPLRFDFDAVAPPPPAALPPMPPPGEERPPPADFEAAIDAALEGVVEGPIIGAIADAFVGEAIEVLDVDEVETASTDDATGFLMQEVLVLDESWRGGDQGLAELADVPSIVNLSIQDAKLTDAALDHIAKLPRLADLSVRGSQITADGLRHFRTKSPKTRIYASGDAMLGINAGRDGPCVLTNIYPGSGAYEAGLQQGDEVLSVGGHKTRDFSDLTIAVFRHKPGDKLAVEFKRGGEMKTVVVSLKDRSALEVRR
jgi:hypothetical protein